MRERMPWWISSIFAAGFVFSSIGLFASLAALREDGSMTARLVAFTIFFLLFGWAVLRMLLPIRPRPRIVPYFAAELVRSWRRHDDCVRARPRLVLEITALDALAHSRGVKPLSTFGFASTTSGSKSIGTRQPTDLRRRRRSGRSGTAPQSPRTSSARPGAAHRRRKGRTFSLVLRFGEKDSLQVVCTRETRQGSFW
jgi:hypothetical protein